MSIPLLENENGGHLLGRKKKHAPFKSQNKFIMGSSSFAPSCGICNKSSTCDEIIEENSHERASPSSLMK